MRTNWIARRGSFPSRSSPRSFDMLGGAASLSSSWVVARLLVASRAVVASPCLACFLPLVRASPFLRRVCLLSVPLYRRIVRLPARSTSGAGRIRVAFRFGFASVAVACCLPWLGRGCGGAVFLSWVLLVVAVSMASAVCVIFFVPVVCFALVIIVGRHGLIVVGRCLVAPLRRRLSWLIVVSPCLPSGGVVIRVRPVGHPPLIVSLIVFDRLVDRLVDRFAARLLALSYLSCGGGGGRCGFSLVPLCDPLLGVPSSWSRSAPVGRFDSLIRLLVCRLNPCGGALPLAWLVVAAFPPSPVSRAVCLCG